MLMTINAYDDIEMTKRGGYLLEFQTRTRSWQERQHFHCPWQSPSLNALFTKWHSVFKYIPTIKEYHCISITKANGQSDLLI